MPFIQDALTLGLADELASQIVHLNSSVPRFLNLSISNRLSSQVKIQALKDPPGPNNYHFHIQFVDTPVFYNSPTLKTPDWSMKAIPEHGFVTDLYLLSKQPITLAASSPKDTPILIKLQYTNARQRNAALEVIKTVVTVGKNVASIPDDKTVNGTTTVHLTTFTDTNAPTPLIATLVEPKTILNNGTPSSLLLRLVNTSSNPVRFAPPPEPGGRSPTAIELSFDINDTAAWALCKSGETNSLTIDRPANWETDGLRETTEQVGDLKETTRKTWIFRPKYSATTRIEANSALVFSLKEVKTTLPPGFTNLYVTLREFPIYGTQTAVVQIEKSPLIYNSRLNSGLLSKGTTGANHGLALSGNTSTDLLLVEQSGGGRSAHFKGGIGVSIENNLAVTGEVRLDDGVLWLRGDANHGVAVYGVNNKLFAKQKIEGPVVFGLGGGGLGSKTGVNEKLVLSWKSTGNVGIGTNEPKSMLSVKGGMALGSTYAEGHEASSNGLIVEGSVGIGTPAATKAKLHVVGNVKNVDNISFAFYALYNYAGEIKPYTGMAHGDTYNSIYADGRIVGSEFNAFSDARIKNVIGPSDSTQDLATLMQIEVADYTYKDTVAHGNRLHKKIIGQQLKDVYDQAVSLSTDVVPDIFQTAECLDDWIYLNPTLLQQSDRVRIIPENGSESIVEVTEVEPNRFRVSPSLANGPVFVYGREVNDFLTVDYDAVTMLNVSATQQIKREKDAEVQALRQENASLRARLEHLESLIERLVSSDTLNLSVV